MDIRKIDWSLFRSFLAVIDSGSLLGAAKMLGSHQPTLTRHISELEAQLGATLFERTGRGLLPTAAGRAIVEGARAMAAGMSAIEASIIGSSAAITGVARISASEVVAAFVLPGCLALLRTSSPQIQIELVASNQVSNLLRRDADIAVRMVRPTQATLIARKLGELTLGLYASSGYIARFGAPDDSVGLIDHSLIGLDSDESLIRGFQAGGLPLTRQSFSVRTDNQVAYIRLIQEGAGIGVVPKVVAKRIDDLCAVLPDLLTAALLLWLVVHREIEHNPLIRRVYDFLAAEVPRRIKPL